MGARRHAGLAAAAALLAAWAPSASTAPAVHAATATQTNVGHPSGFLLAQDRLPFLREQAAAGQAPIPVASPLAPSGGNISQNLHFLSNLPLPSAISVAFIGDVAFVSTVLGVYSVDISDPTNPTVLDVLPMYIWENEHMTVDPVRKLIVVARDPRGFTTPATTAFPYGAVHVIDVSNPSLMKQVGFHLQATGHTATCINDCRFLWVSGPASPKVQAPTGTGADPTWGGRPTWGLDLSDPTNPVDCPHFIDLDNHDGQTDYDHDIDVDTNGVAWISGSGHLRGFWTSGTHLDPRTGRLATATGCEPIPYAGANTAEGTLENANPNAAGVIHNSHHNLALGVDGRPGDLITATEEVTVTDCTISGRFLTYDLQGTLHGEGVTGNATLKRLDAWTPENKPGSTGCDSAHWYTDRGDGLVAIAFYTQGTRLLDVRDPHHITQVGYYNVPQTDTWAAYWHGHNEIVVADFERGLDILQYDDTRAAAPTTTTNAPAAPLPAAGAPAGLANTAAAVPGAGLATLAVLAVPALRRRRRRQR